MRWMKENAGAFFIVGFLLLMAYSALQERSFHNRCEAVMMYAPNSEEAVACEQHYEADYEEEATTDPRY